VQRLTFAIGIFSIDSPELTEQLDRSQPMNSQVSTWRFDRFSYPIRTRVRSFKRTPTFIRFLRIETCRWEFSVAIRELSGRTLGEHI
jgi:hypothetical protein